MRVGLAVIVVSVLFCIKVSFAQDARVVCIGSGGSLTVREGKCVGGETKASMKNLPQEGAKGDTGSTGGVGLGTRRIERIADDFIHYNDLGQSRVFAFCNNDEVVLGGGCGCFNDEAGHGRISSSGPMPVVQSNSGRAGWRCAMISGSDYDADFSNFRAYAICAQAN
jgi:hypothetical protein